MKALLNRCLFTSLVIIVLCSFSERPSWGFYGHRLINQQAVFILPLALQQYFLPHMDYLSRHAVDPDKRRYAIKDEASHHYFDTEKWEPFIRDSAICNRSQLIDRVGDLVLVCGTDSTWIDPEDSIFCMLVNEVPRYYTGHSWSRGEYEVWDTMAVHGLLPLAILGWYTRLVKAFQSKDENILKVAADLGHYLGDAHVPLHTTVNYNGQLTGQLGIHAFWETHVPEALAEARFDLVSGGAILIDDVESEAWRIVRESHSMVDSVLRMESDVRRAWKDENENCTRSRLGRVTEVPCPQILEAYHRALNGMVERQMRKAIRSIASFWWTAYVEAGQPVLDGLWQPVAGENNKAGPVHGRLSGCE